MEISLVWLLIGGELLLVLTVALVTLLMLGLLGRKRDRQAAMHLIGKVKKAETQRKETITEWLKQGYGLDGEALQQKVHDIVQAEKLLIQRVVNLYVKRDRISLRELDIDVEALSEPLRKLEGPGGAPAAGDAATEPATPADGDDGLRQENEALKQELQITMETMSRMLSEYASMFGNSSSGGMGAPTMQEALDNEADGNFDGFDADAEPDIGEGIADLADDEDLKELEEFDDLEALDGEPPPSPDPDETVAVDLSDDDITNLFDGDDDFADLEPEKPPRTDAEGNAMDDDLADMWADALGEQDESPKK